MNRPIRSSHLALRFYKSDGWAREDLLPYLLKGRIQDTEEDKGDQPHMAYYRLEVGGALDMDRLYVDEEPIVIRWYDGAPRESDLEYLKSMNW